MEKTAFEVIQLARYRKLLADFHSVADFGLSSAQKEEKNSGPKPLAWVAPELMNDSPPSFKTDVFSFGVVLWEILCRRSPHTSWLALIAKATKREMKDVDVGEVASAVCNKKRLPLPRDSPPDFA